MIRSFDNQGPYEIIKFRGCLTLIVGVNGSGKTTIIECLRYATTGELPPNSKNGAFVHDPKLTQEKEVKAGVKLKFRSGPTEFVVARHLQVTLGAKAKMTMKALETSFQILRNGERTALSKRTADINKFVPQRLGVPEAVLSNVLFCHQDEALWPMSTANDLKKKFDLIFDASKYTKAVDNLLAMKKERNAALGKLRIHVENDRVNKDKGERMETKSRKLQEDLDNLEVEVKKLEKEMKQIKNVSISKRKEAEEAAGVVNNLKLNRERASIFKEQIERLRTDLTELPESDAWLARSAAQYDERMAELKQQREEYDSEVQNFAQQLAQLRRDLSRRQAEHGQHLADKNAYENKLSSREELVKEAASRHSIRGYDSDLSQAQVGDFVTKMNKALRDKDRELQRAKKSIEDELQQARAVESELKTRREVLMDGKLTATKAMKDNDLQSRRVLRDIDAINVDEGSQAMLEGSLEDAQSRKQKAERDFQDADWERRHREAANQLHDVESQSEKLQAELMQYTKYAKDQAALEHVKKALQDAHHGLDTMKSTYGTQFTAALGPDWQVETLEREFQAVTSQKLRSVNEAKKVQEKTKYDLDSVGFTLKTLKAELDKNTKLEESHRSSVLASIQDIDGNDLQDLEEYEEALKDLEETRDDARKNLDSVDTVAEFYKKAKTEIEHKDRCKLCQRKFADPKESKAAAEKIDKLLLGNTKKTYMAALKQSEAELRKGQEVRPKYDSAKNLSENEIPRLKKELEAAERKHAELLSVLERHDTLVSQEESAKRDIDALSKPVTSIVGYAAEISKRETEISRISSQQKMAGSELTVEELNEQIISCEKEKKAARQQVNDILSDKHAAEKAIASLELAVSNATSELNSARNELQKKQSLVAELSRFEDSKKDYDETKTRADAELQALIPQAENAKAKLEEAQQRGRERESELQADKDKLNGTVNQFKLLENDINAYIESGGPDNLEAVQQKIHIIEKSQKHTEDQLSEAQHQVEELKQRVNDSAKTKRDIDDNIQFRKFVKNLNECQSAISILEQQNVEGEYERLDEEANRAENKFQVLQAQRGPLVGSAHEKDKQLKENIDEWTNEYKDAAQKFRKSHIEVETTKAAIEDIDKYRRALDNAIMKYHSMKMEETNRIAGEIWTNTYQGTDIDTIMIKSEVDTNTTSDRKNYNYRVVMVKSDVEMDMRGRCSAGQKILASIVIRLALAECFGIGCGIIALDEPTTNLDQHTIISLAESLNSIIQQRKSQANFQLVIITHDEEFLRAMKPQEFTDTFWRVSRNERQKSVINEERIQSLMG